MCILTPVLDIDEFLPEATFNWCRTQLLKMGFDHRHPPKIPCAERFITFRTIYLQFREVVSAHIASNADPVLALSEAPHRPKYDMTSCTAED